MMFIMSGRNWSHKSSQILALNLQEWNMWNPNTKIKYRATGPCRTSNGERVTMATAPGHNFALGAIEANGANGTLGTQWN